MFPLSECHFKYKGDVYKYDATDQLTNVCAAGKLVDSGCKDACNRLASLNMFYKQVAQTGIAAATVMGVGFGVIFGWLSGMIAAVLSGSVAVALLAVSGTYQRFRLPMSLDPGERVLMSVPANRLTKWEAVGGWVYLTENRLLFWPHPLNIQRRQIAIALQDVASVHLTFMKMSIVCKSGSEHRFRVWEYDANMLRREIAQRVTSVNIKES